ncbi:hypothetical protein SDC9_98035 [bioreactor metagenome]|uniref:Peptidase M10 metallopeptidase domain-containing protein n=1 Tax=bioreactor metagenome TaxID=1076179 RepID=A0A645AE35_9ZZZZ
MKRGILKTALMITVVLMTLCTSVYALTSYRLNGYPHSGKYVYLENLLGDSYYSQRLDNAMFYWTNSAAHVGIWKSYSSSNDQIVMQNDGSTTVEGVAYPYDPGDGSTAYYITINKYSIDKANTSGTQSYIEGALVHEIGHLFGLDDLKFFDSHSQIMSYYNDRNLRCTPQSGDIAGVNSIYP